LEFSKVVLTSGKSLAFKFDGFDNKGNFDFTEENPSSLKVLMVVFRFVQVCLLDISSFFLILLTEVKLPSFDEGRPGSCQSSFMANRFEQGDYCGCKYCGPDP
jgi:hypothetical protein